jgi:predicted amidohydrolase YtcJ
MPETILASVRQPGETRRSNTHLAGGVVSRITAAEDLRGGVRMADLDGRYVIPGLWDEHVHMTQWALAANRIDLSGAGSARKALDVVRSHLADHRADRTRTVVGVGFRRYLAGRDC